MGLMYTDKYKKASEYFDEFKKSKSIEILLGMYTLGECNSSNIDFVTYLKDTCKSEDTSDVQNVEELILFDEEIDKLNEIFQDAEDKLLEIKNEITVYDKYMSSKSLALGYLESAQENIDSEYRKVYSALSSKVDISIGSQYNSPLDDTISPSNDCVFAGNISAYSDLGGYFNNISTTTMSGLDSLVNEILSNVSGNSIDAFCEHIKLFNDSFITNQYGEYYEPLDIYQKNVSTLDYGTLNKVALTVEGYTSPSENKFEEYNNIINESVSTKLGIVIPADFLGINSKFNTSIYEDFEYEYKSHYEDLLDASIQAEEDIIIQTEELKVLNNDFLSYIEKLQEIYTSALTLNSSDVTEYFVSELNTYICANFEDFNITLDQANVLNFTKEQNIEYMNHIFATYGEVSDTILDIIEDGKISEDEQEILLSYYYESLSGNMQILDAIELTLSIYLSTPGVQDQGAIDAARTILGINSGIRDLSRRELSYNIDDINSIDENLMLHEEYASEIYNEIRLSFVTDEDGDISLQIEVIDYDQPLSKIKYTITPQLSTLEDYAYNLLLSYVGDNEVAKEYADNFATLFGIGLGFIPIFSETVDIIDFMDAMFNMSENPVYNQEELEKNIKALIESSGDNSVTLENIVDVYYNMDLINSEQREEIMFMYTVELAEASEGDLYAYVASSTITTDSFFQKETIHSSPDLYADSKTTIVIEQGNNLVNNGSYDDSKEIVEANGVGIEGGTRIEYIKSKHDSGVDEINGLCDQNNICSEYNSNKYIYELEGDKSYLDFNNVINEYNEYYEFYPIVNDSIPWKKSL